MQLGHPLWEDAIDLADGFVHTLVIENPACFRTLTAEWIAQTEGADGGFILTDGLTVADIAKNAEWIGDPFTVSAGDNRRLLTAIQKEMAEVAIHEKFAEWSALFTQIQTVLADLAACSDTELTFDEINDPAAILKWYALRPDDRDLPFAERILQYMELCMKYLKKRLFVIPHLHGCLSEKEMASFCKDALYRKAQVLIVETVDCIAGKQERKQIIDRDLCFL